MQAESVDLMKTKIKVTVVGIIVVGLIVAAVFVLFSRQSFQRTLKDLKSDYTGGIQRTVTVYDYNGNPVETYKGKFDIDDDKESGTTKFDLNGKRTIIKGGIVIIQED